MRPGRSVRDQERLSPGRRTRHCHRSLRRTARARVLPGRCGDAELRGRRRPRRAPPHDRRAGSGRVHRRGRPRSTRHDARRLVRPSEDVDVPGDRSPACASAGHQRVPEGRHGLDSRRLRRMAGQVSAGRRIRQGADAQDGPDPHAQVHAHPARAHRTRRDRSVLHHHAPDWSRRCAGDVSHVSRQTRCVHQGRHETRRGDVSSHRIRRLLGSSDHTWPNHLDPQRPPRTRAPYGTAGRP